MAGIMDKIGGALHIGGNKTEEQKKHSEATHKTDEHAKYGEPAKHAGEHKQGEQKEGFLDKIKDKIHGGEGGEHKEGEKKKKEKKKKGEGHHGGDSSSSSDSD